MNLVILSGRLTRDAEIKKEGERNGKKIAVVSTFSIALNESNVHTGEEKTLFINCVAFNKSSKLVREYLKKGKKILIEGKVDIEEYEKDGQSHKQLKVIVEKIELC